MEKNIYCEFYNKTIKEITSEKGNPNTKIHLDTCVASHSGDVIIDLSLVTKIDVTLDFGDEGLDVYYKDGSNEYYITDFEGSSDGLHTIYDIEKNINEINEFNNRKEEWVELNSWW